MSSVALGVTTQKIESRFHVRANALSFTALAGYAFLLFFTIHRHEPWADEAQAWLLARDASFSNLWLRLLHYEGSPGIWQSLLFILTRIGVPYAAYSYVSGVIAGSGVWLLVRYAPFPLPFRILLPFTYYLCYQYAVVARSYVLFAPLLFAIALLYKRVAERPFLFITLLCLLAGISVHGFVISGAIWVVAYVPVLFRWRDRSLAQNRRVLWATVVYALVLLIFVLAAWPAKDVAFAENRGLTNLRYFSDVAAATFAGAFTGDWITAVAAVGLSLPFLWRGGGWFFLLLVNAILLLFGTLVYAQLWHFGIFFLAWLFAIWISALRTKITAPTLIALGVVVACQCYWTIQSMAYDWKHRYSASWEAALYFHKAGIPKGGLYAIGYPCTAIEPYFPANIYSNFNNGGRAAYWDWSKRNSSKDAVALFSSRRRDLVLVGYKNEAERSRWKNLLNMLGYEQFEHFEGSTYWQTAIFESEAFDLFRRGSGPPAIEARSSIDIGDADAAIQLLDGFYGVEMHAWRWTAARFSVALKPPAGAVQSGAMLKIKLFLPQANIQSLGPVTLRADLDGYTLPDRTFSSSGSYIYDAAVPAKAMGSHLVTATFYLNKVLKNLKTDPRELGAIVSSIGLEVSN